MGSTSVTSSDRVGVKTASTVAETSLLLLELSEFPESEVVS
jgi:hypothetical protein